MLALHAAWGQAPALPSPMGSAPVSLCPGWARYPDLESQRMPWAESPISLPGKPSFSVLGVRTQCPLLGVWKADTP